MKIEVTDLREIQLLKYYRLVRKWACKTNKLKDADLELLIHFDCMNTFTRDDYIKGTYIYSWDKARWERLRKEGWIDVYAYRNRTTIKYTVYKVSTKCKYLISRIYRILLGKEDIPMSSRSIYSKRSTYSDKVFGKAAKDMYNDKNR